MDDAKIDQDISENSEITFTKPEPWWVHRNVVPPPPLYIPPPNWKDEVKKQRANPKEDKVPVQTYTLPLYNSKKKKNLNFLGPHPLAMRCPTCHKLIVTRVREEKVFQPCWDKVIFLCCGLCMLLFCPSTIKRMSSVSHYCPSCNSVIHEGEGD